MPKTSWTGLIGLAACAWSAIACAGGADLTVKETTGIRRTAYPVNGRVALAKGELADPAHVRLLLDGREVPVQATAESRRPDGSIEWLDVDFNASIGPLEQQTYRVEFGDGVNPAVPAGATGLAVTQTADAVQVSRVRLGKTPSPLVLSVMYRQEDIGQGPNGFTVIDDKGMAHVVTSDAAKAEIVKSGPLDVLVRYTGKAAIDAAYSVGFTVTVEMPNSKSWNKYSVAIDDPAKRIRDVAFQSPIAFGGFPVLWDFGTGSWTYGALRDAPDSVTLTQTVKPGADGWKIETTAKGQSQLYETAAGARPKIAEGWGHFQDGKEVIAFAFDRFGREPGTYTVTFDGAGHESFQFAAAQPAAHHRLTVYQHYVGTPTQIGAATSPASMLNPLLVTISRPR